MRTKQTVVCELGGEDPKFQDMYDGQKGQYASMICVPAIEDIPAEKVNEVYGILTIDTRVRRGYFEAGLMQFWAGLFEPICSMLLYCDKSERRTKAVVAALRQVASSSTMIAVSPSQPPLAPAPLPKIDQA